MTASTPGLQFESFKYDTPERDVGVNLLWEVVEDFFLGLTLLESYDSSPPVEEAEKSDLSLITSLGWSF